MPISPQVLTQRVEAKYDYDSLWNKIDKSLEDNFQTELPILVHLPYLPSWVLDKVCAQYRTVGWSSVTYTTYSDQRDSGSTISFVQ